MAINGNLPLWLERILLPGAWDITVGEGQTVSAHWAQHYYQHGYGATVAEAMDLFHEDLMRTPGFETDYRSTIGPVALAAALPHPYSHELIFPHLRAGQKSQSMVTKYTSDMGFGYGDVYGSLTDVGMSPTILDSYLPEQIAIDEVHHYASDVSDLGFGYGQRTGEGWTYDPALGMITDSKYGDPTGFRYHDEPIGLDWRTDPMKRKPESVIQHLTREQAGLPPLKEKDMPMNGTASVTALDFGYGAGAYSIPSMAPGYTRPRRASSQRVSVGKNIPRSKTMAKLNKYMHEWRKEIRQITGRLGGFYGPARPSTRTSGRRRSVGRHRHKINSFDYQRQGRTVHSHRVKSRRR